MIIGLVNLDYKLSKQKKIVDIRCCLPVSEFEYSPRCQICAAR